MNFLAGDIKCAFLLTVLWPSFSMLTTNPNIALWLSNEYLISEKIVGTIFFSQLQKIGHLSQTIILDYSFFPINPILKLFLKHIRYTEKYMYTEKKKHISENIFRVLVIPDDILFRCVLMVYILTISVYFQRGKPGNCQEKSCRSIGQFFPDLFSPIRYFNSKSSHSCKDTFMMVNNFYLAHRYGGPDLQPKSFQIGAEKIQK